MPAYHGIGVFLTSGRTSSPIPGQRVHSALDEARTLESGLVDTALNGAVAAHPTFSSSTTSSRIRPQPGLRRRGDARPRARAEPPLREGCSESWPSPMCRLRSRPTPRPDAPRRPSAGRATHSLSELLANGRAAEMDDGLGPRRRPRHEPLELHVSRHRVAVTGMGVVSPLGSSVEGVHGRAPRRTLRRSDDPPSSTRARSRPASPVGEAASRRGPARRSQRSRSRSRRLGRRCAGARLEDAGVSFGVGL